MSLTRRMLKAMGIEGDAIEQIIEAHTETTDEIKAERDRYKEESGKVKGLEEELDKTRKQLEQAVSDDGYDELKKRFDEQANELKDAQAANDKLKGEFDSYKEATEAKETERRKTEAYREILDKAGIAPKYVGAVLRVADLSGIELEDDGTVKDADKLTEKVRGEYPEFVAKTETKGADTENPPAASKTTEGAHDRALQIAKERHERLYGKSEE